MWLGALGRLLKAIARFHGGEGRADLEHVAEELVRLDRARRQAPATSR
ncbi:MAG TPA: hypothetical protein VMH49_01890 [Thermoplasmata archaeon]|nr:hypothetical protein [Thermoplasmata archaeon]